MGQQDGRQGRLAHMGEHTRGGTSERALAGDPACAGSVGDPWMNQGVTAPWTFVVYTATFVP